MPKYELNKDGAYRQANMDRRNLNASILDKEFQAIKKNAKSSKIKINYPTPSGHPWKYTVKVTLYGLNRLFLCIHQYTHM